MVCALCFIGGRMKRIITVLLIVLSVVSFQANAEEGYYSVQEIRQQMETLLQIENSDGVIEIEIKDEYYPVQIEIPEVDTVAVLKVKCPTLEHLPQTPENGQLQTFVYDGVLAGWYIREEMTEGELYGEWIQSSTRIYTDGEDAHADGSAMTLEESEDFAQRILDAYAEEYGWDFRLWKAGAWSRLYKAVDRGQGFQPMMDEPVSDTGYYELQYEQYLHGIPYYGRSIFVYPSKHMRKSAHPTGDSIFHVFLPQTYFYNLYPAVETGMIAEDIPLCSFETVLDALKNAKIYSSTPSKLRLVYTPWTDPQDKEGDLILLPTWILQGSSAWVNAQSGELIDFEQKDQDGQRGNAVWFAWDDVKE